MYFAFVKYVVSALVVNAWTLWSRRSRLMLSLSFALGVGCTCTCAKGWTEHVGTGLPCGSSTPRWVGLRLYCVNANCGRGGGCEVYAICLFGRTTIPMVIAVACLLVLPHFGRTWHMLCLSRTWCGHLRTHEVGNCPIEWHWKNGTCCRPVSMRAWLLFRRWSWRSQRRNALELPAVVYSEWLERTKHEARNRCGRNVFVAKGAVHVLDPVLHIVSSTAGSTV